MNPEITSLTPMPGEAISAVQSGCTECGACVTQCAFLQEYGTPKAILEALDSGGFNERSPAFECSLCHLCSAVCPEHLEPGKMFHALRRQAVASETVDLKPFRTILGYEKRGGSRLFSYYGLPRGCDTVFFPGVYPAGNPAGNHLADVLISKGSISQPGCRPGLLHETQP